jgi:death on curing protein
VTRRPPSCAGRPSAKAGPCTRWCASPSGSASPARSTADELLDGPEIRDVGLLDSAAYRPQASAFGQEAYPTTHGKAAALLDAVVRHHALVDGNKRLGWAAAVDEAVDLVVAVAASHLDLSKLSQTLAGWAHPDT